MEACTAVWKMVMVASILASSVVVCNGIVTRPPSVPLGAEWLNTMPRGNELNPPANQPVREVNWKTCKPGVKVVEYLYAEVGKSNLGRGTNTNQAIRDWVAGIGQSGRKQKDDAGHIIGKNQGGLGTVQWNIFPQSQNFNRGVYARDAETVVNAAAAHDGVAKLWFHLSYGDAQYPCRPTKFDYYLLTASISLHNDIANPHNP